MPKPITATADNSTNVRIQAPTPIRAAARLASGLAPAPTARVAARLFCLTHGPRRPTARERTWLADAHPFELDAGGRTLAAWSWGDGPTVLLHHGWSGRGAQLGAFVAPLVTSGYSVVAYDAPGHGASPGRTSNGVLMANALTDAVRSLDGVHAVVAHSLGCVALGYALRRRLPIDRAVFLCPPADMATYTDAFVDAFGFSPRVRDEMLAHFERSLDMDWRRFTTEAFACDDRAARGGQTPLLVVRDHDDREVPAGHAPRVHAAWEGSELLETRGLGHRRILRDPEVIARVTDWVSVTRSTAPAPAATASATARPRSR